MTRVLIAFARRPAAGVGLTLAVVWVGVVAAECYAVSPWDGGGWYARAVETADFAWRGVAGLAAFVWLLERAAG
jgi:hypothetical protein